MPQCLIRIVSDLNHAHRSVAVLEGHSASYANLDGMNLEEERYHLKSFEYWVGGFHINERFHGWNKSQYDGKYTKCFVFKNVAAGERFYGFLCRPKATDPQYEMCVLVLYAQKKKWKTDASELARADDMSKDTAVLAALKDPKLFTKRKGKKK